MAEFEALAYRLTIEPHPDADRLELARVGDYYSIVAKNQFRSGDLGVYIPEGAVCPDWVIQNLGLEGKLAGPRHNRVKAVRLRGIFSQGIIYPKDKVAPSGHDGTINNHILHEGDDATAILELAKYEPPIPIHMAGEVDNAHGYTLKYDIENIKKWPYILLEGEPVTITEKIHGTWCCLGHHSEFGPIVVSKGLAAQGLAFRINEANAHNIYVQAYHDHAEQLELLRNRFPNTPIYLLGEIFGPGVQDLHYGLSNKTFRVFDLYTGAPNQGRFLDPAELATHQDLFQTVPTLYEGPFSRDTLRANTDGLTTTDGVHVREGCVVRPNSERFDPSLGRVILKSVSESYLLRKGGSELQ